LEVLEFLRCLSTINRSKIIRYGMRAGCIACRLIWFRSTGLPAAFHNSALDSGITAGSRP
jgi:hypothetical protein